MSGPNQVAAGRVVVVLLVVHVTVAVGLYIAAFAFGEGFAGPPFPRDEAVVVLREDPPRAARVARAPDVIVTASSTAVEADPRDTAPAWRFDTDGRALLPDR